MFTFAIFAGAFMMRIAGGLLFGYIGDKCGRRNALFMSILLMSISTTLMGCLPTFAMVSYAAPIMLFMVRLCQGLSVGGQVCFWPACEHREYFSIYLFVQVLKLCDSCATTACIDLQLVGTFVVSIENAPKGQEGFYGAVGVSHMCVIHRILCLYLHMAMKLKRCVTH